MSSAANLSVVVAVICGAIGRRSQDDLSSAAAWRAIRRKPISARTRRPRRYLPRAHPHGVVKSLYNLSGITTWSAVLVGVNETDIPGCHVNFQSKPLTRARRLVTQCSALPVPVTTLTSLVLTGVSRLILGHQFIY